MSELPSGEADAPQTTELRGGKRQAAMGFIFATALMDVISLGIMIPVLPNLVKEMVGGDTATATHWTGLFAMSWGVMQFFCSPIMGMLSDRFGRRRVLLISIFGLGVDYIFMALSPNLLFLYIGRLINGATAASFSTAGAYIADITAPENRAKSFGLLGAAFSIGFIIGPAIGGYLGDINIRLPFYVAAGMALINWLYGYFVLPESLPPEKRLKKFNWAKANPIGSLKLLRSHPDLSGLASVTFLFQIAHNVFPSIFVLYAGYRFGWSFAQVGLMMMLVGAIGALIQFLVVGPAVKRLGERGALILGLFSMMVGFVWYASATSGFAFALGVPIAALAALIGPGLNGLMSRRVAPYEQGQLQGANSAIMGVTAILGPPLFTTLFAFSIDNADTFHIPGLPLYVAAFLALCALGLALRVARPAPPPIAEASTP